MRVLSVRQPWAALIVAGWKDIENRTWQTSYRGRIAVHASGKFDWSFFDWCGDCELADAVRVKFGIKPGTKRITKNKRLFSAIIGTVEITGCIDTESPEANKITSPWCFFTGYAWTLANAQKIKPITGIKGKLNLWTFEMPE